MKMRMATHFLHRRTEQTGVTQIWWVVKQKTASFQTYPFLSITHFSQKKKKNHLSIFSRRFPVLLLSGVSQITDPIRFPSHTLPPLLLSHQERYWSLFFSSVLVENFCFRVKEIFPHQKEQEPTIFSPRILVFLLVWTSWVALILCFLSGFGLVYSCL